MEQTGHRSLDGVYSYKRTSEEQSEKLSDIINDEVAAAPKKLHFESLNCY